MSKIMDRIRAHRRSLPMRFIEVPEWGEGEGAPLIIYWRPWNTAEKRDLYNSDGGDNETLLAKIIVAKALDKDGKKMFEPSDEVHLMRGGHDAVVRRVAVAINADRTPGASTEDDDDSVLDRPESAQTEAAVGHAEKN